jgi:6-phosphogluconolactonase (cycloisomerase 2 family)
MNHTLSRRGLIIGSAAVAITTVLPSVADAASADPRQVPAAAADTARQGRHGLIAYVGSRTTAARNARGAGITTWRVPPNGAPWQLLQTIPADDGDINTPTAPGSIPGNPSFLLLSENGRFLYTVHGDDTKVSAFAVNPADGTLTLLNTVDGGRRNPVHLTIDPTGKWLIVACLAPPGSVLTFPLGTDGQLGQLASVLELPGTPGPHKTQQLGPNPHHVVYDPSKRWIVIPDRGVDRVFVAKLDATTGTLTLNDPGWATTRELEGPRHVAFHPARPLAFVANVLRGTVTSYSWDSRAGILTPLQTLSSTPTTMTGDSRAAEIEVSRSGRYVYVSNRRGADTPPVGDDPDTIGIFEIRHDGLIEPVRWVSTQGIRPRFFGQDPAGRQLFAANELTDTIVGYSITAAGAQLRPYGIVAETGSPVSIVFTGQS